MSGEGVQPSQGARLHARGTIALVTFDTMLDGRVTETAQQAYDTAVDLAARTFNPDIDSPELTEPAVAELAHDALMRFTALSFAGLLKVIS